MAMKHLLYLAATAGFLTILIVRAKPAPVPYNTLLTELETVQEEIVTVHNNLRRGVIPSASNMLKMFGLPKENFDLAAKETEAWRRFLGNFIPIPLTLDGPKVQELEIVQALEGDSKGQLSHGNDKAWKDWSEEAAQNARMLSTQCELRESSAPRRRITNTFCGENMHLTSYAISWSNVIEIWYNESKYFKYGEWTSMDNGITIEHYTQVVWATSYLIGCGISSCPKRMSTQYLYVCHYCHEGNDFAKRNEPYNVGNPCEDCPNDCENKLCTNPCLYYDEYNNCKTQKRSFGCSRQWVQQFCKASCLCDTEIK